ncbi:hypothetical protein FRC12_010935 [Ceratobasidium sp. 428]|nr:hypothetical protein FRC12_010935 [Ceratobasidium sp. 428]
MLSRRQLDILTQTLRDEHITLSELFCSFISLSEPDESISAYHEELCSATALNAIIHALLSSPDTAPIIARIARNVAVRSYVRELGSLLSPSAGFQFNVAHAAPSQFTDFSSMKMANTFEEMCPLVWQLFGALLNVVSIRNEATSANNRGDYLTELTYRHKADKPSAASTSDTPIDEVTVDTVDDMPDEDWGTTSDEEPGAGGSVEGQGNVAGSVLTGAPWHKDSGKAVRRQVERTHIRRIALFCICINNSNMRCNTLQAIIGLFAHSTGTAERVIEFLSHAGLSIAPSSVNRMISHMSSKAQKSLKGELAGLISAFGYDNLEVRFDTEQPTAENQGKLVSMTTAAFFPLRAGVTKEDLRVCEELWARSEFNPHRSLPPVVLSHDRMMSMMRKVTFDAEDERSVESLFAWHVRDILLNESVDTLPEDIKQLFRKEALGSPVQRSWLPHTKTKQKVMRTMNISVSTTHGNAAAIENILEQGGVVKEDLKTHAVLVHGDLGSGEKLWSLQESRGIEDEASDRLQWAVFAPGWLHICMAIADAIRRLFFDPERPRTGHPTHPHSIFHLCALLRPREIGKISTNPGFRRTHSLIEHLALATISDAWRLVVKARFGVELKEWRPTWEQVVDVSRQVVREYVAPFSYRPARRPGPTKDLVQDQIRLFNQNALLYLGIRRAARYGDVRRVRDLLPFWVYIWKSTGKHKYAKHITRFLTCLDGGWPDKLSKVVQDNWFANPTGKKDGFRGVDWMIERDNYFQKCQYSGSSSNRTLDNLRKESPLIEDYHAVQGIMERNFYLTPPTTRHPPPIMKTSLNVVRTHLEGEKMSSHQSGRTLSSLPVNAFAAGVAASTLTDGEMWLEGENDEDGDVDMEGGDDNEEIQPEDLAVDE